MREAIRVIGPSIAYLPLTRGCYSLIDSDNAGDLERRPWSTCKGYARHSQMIAGKWRRVTIHGLLLQCADGRRPDHRNGNKLDNRIANLRPATVVESNRNRRVHSNNKSGIKGVFFRRGRWTAQIYENRKSVYLGSFSTKEEAASAYNRAADNMFGEFARVA